METNKTILSPRNQLQNHLAMMSNVENNAILRFLEEDDVFFRSENLTIMKKIINAAQVIFFKEALFWSTKGREDSAQYIEEMIEKFTPQFLSFIVELEFGTVNLGPTIGTLKRLPKNLGKLKNLRKLYLNGQPIEDLEPLRNLELDFLCAEGCPITDPTPVSLKRLSWFNMDDTRIENIEYLKHAPLIAMQKIPGCLSESKIDVLLKMPNLNEFCISRSARSNVPKRVGFFKYDNSGSYVMDDQDEEKIRKERRDKIGSKIIDYHYLDIL